MKTQATEWEKLFAKPVSNTGLVSKSIKSSYNSIMRSQKNEFQ